MTKMVSVENGGAHWSRPWRGSPPSPSRHSLLSLIKKNKKLNKETNAVKMKARHFDSNE